MHSLNIVKLDGIESQTKWIHKQNKLDNEITAYL